MIDWLSFWIGFTMGAICMFISIVIRLVYDNKRSYEWKPEYDKLAEYNSEKSRGIKHEDWKNKEMEIIQSQYNKEYLRQ